jgi:acetylornithine deacetylase/succinyl-diaminopimelate desuccinylase-like protein
MSEAALHFAREHHDRALEALKELLRIPSVSTLPEHQNDIRRAAEWVARHCSRIGLENVQILETPGHPVVYADWLHAEGKPTMLLYGHYDVQPPDPLDEWETPPFEPTVRDENLYARGASDDKGQFLTHLKAIEAHLQADGKLPVNVKLLIEGEEEVGSPGLHALLEAEKERFQCDVVAISDSAMLGPDQPAIPYGLRGLVYGEITVQGPKRDLHSGVYGGAVHNPLQALCEIVAELHDEEGRVAIPSFYDNVRELSPQERDELKKLPISEEEFLRETGVPTPWGEPEFSVLEGVGARPTLEIHGIRGGFTGEGAKTVIPAQATAKVSMRIVPHQTAEEVAKLFEQHVKALTPPTVRVDVKMLQGGDPVLLDRTHPAFEAASKAYEASFGNPPVFTLEGGSIPVVVLLKEHYDAPAVLMGFGLPDDRLHAPNEKFFIPNFTRGIECMIRFLSGLT